MPTVPAVPAESGCAGRGDRGFWAAGSGWRPRPDGGGADAGEATGRWRSGLEMACALYGYWQISGMLREGEYWLNKALERFPEARRERALALVNRGFVRSFAGEIAVALADCEEGIEIALAIGDDAIVARGYQHKHLTRCSSDGTTRR